jgi:hypothetical protein
MARNDGNELAKLSSWASMAGPLSEEQEKRDITANKQRIP